MVPAGWNAEGPVKSTGLYVSLRHRGIAEKTVNEITIKPPKLSRSWMSEWLRMRFYGPREDEAGLELYVGYNAAEEDNRIVRTEVKIDPRNSWYVAARGFDTDKGYSIVYGRQNRVEFEATYRQVCESFKVLR